MTFAKQCRTSSKNLFGFITVTSLCGPVVPNTIILSIILPDLENTFKISQRFICVFGKFLYPIATVYYYDPMKSIGLKGVKYSIIQWLKFGGNAGLFMAICQVNPSIHIPQLFIL